MHIVSRVGIGKIPPSSPLYLDVGGAVNFDSTLHVIGQTTVNSLISSQLSTNSLVYESRVPGDTEILFSINRDGKIDWGAGGITPPDLTLYRSAVNSLRLNGNFTIDNSLIVGDSTNDTATFIARISSNFDPSFTNLYDLGQDSLRWKNLWLSVKLTSADGLFSGDLKVDGNTILGDSNADTLSVNARVATSLIPSVDNLNDLGENSQRWKSLWLGTDLKVDGNTILGDSNADTLSVNARVATSLIPSVDNLNDLGSSFLRWKSLWLGTDLKVDGNTILGDSNADTLSVNARVATSLIPSVDNLNDLGIFNFRWNQINTGPNGLVVRNDDIDTDKISLDINSNIGFLHTSSNIPLNITTGSNTGIIIDTSGKVGINTSIVLSSLFSVNGTSDFFDTAYFSASSGYGLQVESVAGIKGSIESVNLEKKLNIGINEETQYINIGTGDLTKTINIGTGSGPTTINIGGPLDIISLNGLVTTNETTESLVLDKTLTLNVGGFNNTAQGSGLLIEESSSFLAINDVVWQTGNIVRYSAANTGNIQVGSIVLISGFTNSVNNGQFKVVAVSSNSYFEVENTSVNSSLNNEFIPGQTTNPSNIAKILISSDRSGWELYSPLNNSSYFKISNLGANVELTADTQGISVDAFALIPKISETNLGSLTNLWNGFLNDINIYGNSIVGTDSSNTLIINSSASFLGTIDSDLIPSAEKNLGSYFSPWEYLYVNYIRGFLNLQIDGNVVLGTDLTNTFSINSSINSNLIPNTNGVLSIGSALLNWKDMYVNTIYPAGFSEGSVLFINNTNSIAESNLNFFWDNLNSRLYLGQNIGSYILDIAKAGADSIRLRNTTDSQAIALNANSASTKLEFTSSLQFGANTYANVGNGGSTAVLELTSSQVKLLGAVSVNSVSVGAATYTVQPTDVIINVDTMSSGCTITLPSAATKRLLVIKDIGNNASMTNRSIQLSPASNEYVEFNAINAAYVLDRDGESVTLQSDGINRWYII